MNMHCIQNFDSNSPLEGARLGRDTGVDQKIILKYILEKRGVKMWTGLNWLWIVGLPLWKRSWTFGFQKCKDWFLFSVSGRLTSNSWGKICNMEFVTLMSLTLSVIPLAKIDPIESQYPSQDVLEQKNATFILCKDKLLQLSLYFNTRSWRLMIQCKQSSTNS